MKSVPGSLRAFLLPLLTFSVVVAIWWLAAVRGWLVRPGTELSLLPTPGEALGGLWDGLREGKLIESALASIVRVAAGYAISIGVGVPLGLLLGQAAVLREALLPLLNFLRVLSPLAWIPFAVLWIGSSDSAVIFLLVMAALPPVAVTTAAAVASVPRVYTRVAKDYGISPLRQLLGVVFPAVLPQIITMLRVTMGLCWLVLVAAELAAGDRGLGYMIQDANQGLRTDLVVAGMIVIGLLGIVSDRLLMLLTKIPSVRWGYDR
jgi:NitT/TauT family transport system permease protein